MSDHNDIYVRAHTAQLGKKRHKSERKGEPKWPDYALVVDSESRITADQTLTFGCWRFCEMRNGEYVPLEEGIVHDEYALSAKEFDFLGQYAKATKPETANDGCDRNAPLLPVEVHRRGLWYGDPGQGAHRRFQSAFRLKPHRCGLEPG